MIRKNKMKKYLIIFCLLLQASFLFAQNDKLAEREMRDYIQSIDLLNIKYKTDSTLLYSLHSNIKYQKGYWAVYTFCYDCINSLPHIYILFQNVKEDKYIFLGNTNFQKDLIELNNIYMGSDNFKKRLYVDLYKYLYDDYFSNSKGKVIPKDLWNKMKQKQN